MRTKERGGGVYLTFKDGTWPDLPRASQLIETGGFKTRPDEIYLTVTGNLIADGQEYYLNLDRMKSPMRLKLMAADNDKGRAAFGRLKELATQSSAVLEAEGRWQTETAGGSLHLESIGPPAKAAAPAAKAKR